jgi:DNA-binding transcriptional ArsR family regulator
MDKGGLEMLDEEIAKHPDTRLVIIDTLAKFKPPRPAGIDPYEHDYQCGVAIKALADKHNVCILVVHHMRKMKAEDPFDSVSGTFGVTGAADGTLLLVRKMGQADAELHIVGRDVEQEEYALKFNPPTLSWNVMGRLEEIKSTEQKQKLYDAIREYGAEFSPTQIATASGLSQSYVSRMLPYLTREGNVRKLKRGRYEYVS